jgi:anthranilate synthase component 1
VSGAALWRRVHVPAEALRQLAYSDPGRFPVLLDSSATGALGTFSILAGPPSGALWLDRHGVLHSEGLGQLAPELGFIEALEGLMARERATLPVSPPLALQEPVAALGGKPEPALGPFRGGWMLFLSYEMAAHFEPQLQLPAPDAGGDDRDAPPVALALRIPAAVCFDHRSQQAFLVAEAGRADLLEELHSDLQGLASPAAAVARLRTRSLPPLQLQEESPERYRWCVEQALEHIRKGDIYQANLARRWHADLAHMGAQGEKRALAPVLYERLRRANPAPFAALVQHREWRLLSSSPERLVRTCNRHVETRPIAGTRPRSPQPAEDARELATLIAHPKERAEHVMLVDLERNDLGRICEAGSVRVEQLLFTESYAHVHHLVSSVTGRLRERLSALQVLRAVFPGGTITGCPKFRCMQIIAQLEGQARGAYTGGIGYLNHDGSLDFNILIRSLTLSGNTLEFRAGAGIVADSEWERELAETRAKARGLLAALELDAPADAAP